MHLSYALWTSIKYLYLYRSFLTALEKTLALKDNDKRSSHVQQRQVFTQSTAIHNGQGVWDIHAGSRLCGCGTQWFFRFLFWALLSRVLCVVSLGFREDIFFRSLWDLGTVDFPQNWKLFPSTRFSQLFCSLNLHWVECVFLTWLGWVLYLGLELGESVTDRVFSLSSCMNLFIHSNSVCRLG